MTQDELKMVLEFVESINLGSRSASVEQQRQVVAVIKEALAQPEQEPVAIRLWDSQWVNVVNHDNCYQGWDKEDAINHAVKMTEKYIAANVANNTTPPQRKPLTDEQIEQLEQDTCAMEFPETVRAIEAAHGIKENT